MLFVKGAKGKTSLIVSWFRKKPEVLGQKQKLKGPKVRDGGSTIIPTFPIFNSKPS